MLYYVQQSYITNQAASSYDYMEYISYMFHHRAAEKQKQEQIRVILLSLSLSFQQLAGFFLPE